MMEEAAEIYELTVSDERTREIANILSQIEIPNNNNQNGTIPTFAAVAGVADVVTGAVAEAVAVAAPVEYIPKTHLVVASHGIFGAPTTTDMLSQLLTEKYPNILFHSLQSNWGYFFSIASTTDGIEAGGDRIFKEINDICDKNPQLTKISFVGISLGGIYLRYVIGKLYEVDFRGLVPYSYISFASPHVGIADYPNYLQQILISTIGRTTVNQLLLYDNLMLNLSDPDSIYMDGLRRFEKRTVYSNYLYDSKVSYVSGAILPLEFDYYKYKQIHENRKWHNMKYNQSEEDINPSAGDDDTGYSSSFSDFNANVAENDEVFLHESHRKHLFPYNLTDKARIFLEPMLDNKRYPHILLVEHYEHWHNLINAFPDIKKYINKKSPINDITCDDLTLEALDIDYMVSNNNNNIDIMTPHNSYGDNDMTGFDAADEPERLIEPPDAEHHIINVVDDMFVMEDLNASTNMNTDNIIGNNNDAIAITDKPSETTTTSMINNVYSSIINRIPSMSLPSLSGSLPSLQIPTLAMPSLTMPSLQIPTLAMPSLTIPSLPIGVPQIPWITGAKNKNDNGNNDFEMQDYREQSYGSLKQQNVIPHKRDALYDKQLQIVKNMRQIPWTHVTVLFKENFSSYTAHNSINASGPMFSLGTDVVQHCVDSFDKKTK